MRTSASAILVLGITPLLLATPALAQGRGPATADTGTAPPAAPAAPAAPTTGATSTGAAPPSAAPSAAQEEARARFNRALELVDDGDFDAALLELQRAYDLSPSYRILYNLGLVSQQLKQYARAYDAYERTFARGVRTSRPRGSTKSSIASSA